MSLLVAAKKRADRVYVSGHRCDLFATLRHLLAQVEVVGILQIQFEVAVESKEACAQVHKFTFLNGVPQNRAHDSQYTTLDRHCNKVAAAWLLPRCCCVCGGGLVVFYYMLAGNVLWLDAV